MNIFKGICTMDCESKKIFENSKYHDYRVTTAILCLQCTHLIKKDHFIQRVPEEKTQHESLWKHFRTWARNGFN